MGIYKISRDSSVREPYNVATMAVVVTVKRVGC